METPLDFFPTLLSKDISENSMKSISAQSHELFLKLFLLVCAYAFSLLAFLLKHDACMLQVPGADLFQS